MGQLRDYLTENGLYDINEIVITELNDIDTNYGKITWNKNKTFEKFKSQIEDRVRLAHITDFNILSKLIQKAINQKFEMCYDGFTFKEDDTCIAFLKSQFIIIFNRKGKFIRSIRRHTDLDKLMCKTKTKIFEVKYGSENELVDFLTEYEINLDEEEDGYRFINVITEDELLLEVQKVCKLCIQVDL